MAASQLRTVSSLARFMRVPRAAFTTSARQLEAAVPTPNKSQTSPAPIDENKPAEINQAPNRVGTWSRNQQPRSKAMNGPRFEQTDFDLQPQPDSAMMLVHQVPVKWTHSRIVACEGGGGATGHPKVFINTDKPEIAICGYCGNPFANEHHRKYLEALPETSYPLS
ncbi:hypothetical protein NLU13_3002 [Sarocladium strictum]|uniref:Zinc finger CHCC-type domain-containing protein n=1 Tax=Sarocladium strictum TaxID=5046 RepID=A0AA39GNW2_SARSR|nr:hypothetical protein NLU13_3002 [Sarocladium strictum]